MNFQDKVLNIAKKIPRGKVTTYKEIGKALNSRAYRAIGTALKNNPYAPKISCHRVIPSNLTLGSYDGRLNNPKKISLLKKEGIIIKDNKVDKKFVYLFK